jgi:predicted DCC family thiol-disulfide oxidoreductase YuxK
MLGTMAEPQASAPIVFFDGVCGLCNRFVDALLRADRGAQLKFAPLQGDTARRLLPPRPHDAAAWSVVYLDEHGLHERTDALVALGRRLGGAWRLAAALAIVPRPLRDALYGVIARHRYRLSTRRAACRLPPPGDRRFLP